MLITGWSTRHSPGGSIILASQSLSDRAWRGYDLRATIPWLLFGAAVDATILVGRWYVEDVSDPVQRAAVIGAYVTAVVGSSLLVAALLYRTITYTYRLTDRALLIDRGFFSQHLDPVWLDEITEVISRSSWFGRRLGTGRVSVSTVSGRCIRLSGVRDPEDFARMILEQAARAKAEEGLAEASRNSTQSEYRMPDSRTSNR